MNKFFLLLYVLLVSSVQAITPELGVLTYQSNELECPEGKICSNLDDIYCSPNNVSISPNDNGTFDLLFDDFNVTTKNNVDFASASCLLEVPVVVPANLKVALKKVSIAGLTVVPNGGRSTASITYFLNGRESTLIEAFEATRSFAITHTQQLGDEYSNCGSGNAIVSTRFDITASKTSANAGNTFMDLSSGSGRIQYSLDYQDCEPDPDTCTDGQFKLDGTCYNIGNQCSDYHKTKSKVCNNGYDELSCDWDVERKLCYSECLVDQFKYNGNCYDKASVCSEYNGTHTNICNNGSDSIQCNWISSNQTCVADCSSHSTFEIDGQCYHKNGDCSQYNGVNVNTCNNSLDNLQCDWISANFGDSHLANTCVPKCPAGSFELDGQCFKTKGNCSQYNGTSSDICNNGQDNLSCDWIPAAFDDIDLAGTCVAQCPPGSFVRAGNCYQYDGSCSQYNGTDSDTCNNSKDNLLCDWNQPKRTCYPE